MDEVRRPDDDELCGFVAPDDDGDGWVALAVFGARLGSFAGRPEAEDHVLAHGLAALSGPWVLDGEPVRIVEADPTEVVVALDVVAYPGVPTRRIPAADVRRAVLELRPG